MFLSDLHHSQGKRLIAANMAIVAILAAIAAIMVGNKISATAACVTARAVLA
jgi:hypothetical protein